MNVQRAISQLMQSDGLLLPHDILPGSFPGGIDLDFDETRWLAYQWNPPEGLAEFYPAADPAASPKPTWTQLVEADAAGRLVELRAGKQRAVDKQERERICAAYGAASLEEEILYRLRKAGTPEIVAQNAERNRLRARGNALRASVRAAADIAALEAIDPAANANW